MSVTGFVEKANVFYKIHLYSKETKILSVQKPHFMSTTEGTDLILSANW